MAPIWQAIIGALVPIIVVIVIGSLASYFDNGWVLIGIAIYFLADLAVAFFVGDNGCNYIQDNPLKNIAITSLIFFGIMFCALFFSAVIAQDCWNEERAFVISFIIFTLLIGVVSVVLVTNHIDSLNKVYVESDQVKEKKYELSCDENGKFIYYASQNASEEGYYVVIYKNGDEYKPMKIKESKLTILDSVETDETNYLVEVKSIHKKECTNDDSIKPETTTVTTYKVYVPGGAANIGFITGN